MPSFLQIWLGHEFSRPRSLLLALQTHWAQAVSWRAWEPKGCEPRKVVCEVGVLVLDGLLVPASRPGRGVARRPSSAASWCNRPGAVALHLTGQQVLLAMGGITAYEAKEVGLGKALAALMRASVDQEDPETGLGASEKGRGHFLEVSLPVGAPELLKGDLVGMKGWR